MIEFQHKKRNYKMHPKYHRFKVGATLYGMDYWKCSNQSDFFMDTKRQPIKC